MKPSASSTRSSLQNRKAPVWDCPSAGGSSSRTAAACGRAPTEHGVRSFSSHCPARWRPLGRRQFDARATRATAAVKLALSVSYRVGTWRQFEPAKYPLDQLKLTRALYLSDQGNGDVEGALLSVGNPISPKLV